MRQCQKCGNMILDGQVACAKCGTPVQPAQPQATTQTLSGSAMPVMGRPAQPAVSSAGSPAAVNPAAANPAAGNPLAANPATAATPANTAPATQPTVLGAQASPLGTQPVSAAQTAAQPAATAMQPAAQPAQPVQPMQPGAQTQSATAASTTPANPFSRSELPPVQPMQPADSQADKLENSIDQIAAEQPAMTSEMPKKSKGFSLSAGGKISKKTWIIIGACVAVLLVVIIIIVVMMSNNGKSSSSNNKPNTTIVTETKLDIGDYLITVPDGYSYELKADGSVDLTGDSESWIANLNLIDNVSYRALANDFSTVAASFQQLMGVSKVQDAGTATVGGRDYLYVDVLGTASGVTGTYAYTNIGDNVLEIILETSDKGFDHDLLENITPIADGAEKNEGIENSFLGSTRTIVRLDLPELIKTLPADTQGGSSSGEVETVEEIEF